MLKYTLSSTFIKNKVKVIKRINKRSNFYISYPKYIYIITRYFIKTYCKI